MYFPHLFARGEELLALRGLCDLPKLSKTTIPILEGVTENSKSLKKCLSVLGEAKVKAIVITNPTAGHFKDHSSKDWEATLADEFKEHESIVPGFRCMPQTKLSDVKAFLKHYPDKEVAILYWSPKFSNEELTTLAAEPRVKFHVSVHGQLSKAQRAILPKKKAVDIVDRFKVKARNADYSGTEFFSEHHSNYKENGMGYGDFSVIGPKFVKGGGQAHAVAMHIVYQLPNSDELWVEHFVSDDTDPDVGTVSGKYLQAASKVVDAASSRPKEFSSTVALKGYATDVKANRSSGLGMSKRRQISHHVEFIHNWLLENS